MSSSNEAFHNAYGGDNRAVAQTTAPAPMAAPQPAPSQPLGNWYSASAWYRAETAAAPAVAPHVPFGGAYQPPSTADLGRLPMPLPHGGEPEYRLSPAEAVPAPEVIIDDEVPAAASPAAMPDLAQLFTPTQIIGGWEASLPLTTPVTTVGHIPVVAANPAKATIASPQSPAPTAKAVAPPAPTAAAAPVVKAPVQTPRLDAAVTAPVPKPHASFSPKTTAAPPAPTTKLPEPPPKPVAPPPVAAPVATPPLGLMQPAWEVDRFQWPEHCKQLLSTENEYLADVGVRLATAARDGLNILAITSTRRGEGRTTLALCLARAAAKAGVKVALVDADTDNPQLVNELGVEAACGWQDVVLNKQPLSEAAIVSLEDKFALFPWTDSTSLKSLNDPRATRVLRDIAKAYSLVILDLAPVPGRETRLFEDGDACPIDAAILVRDVRWTSAIEAQRVAAQLTAAGVESVGIAENFGPRAKAA